MKADNYLKYVLVLLVIITIFLEMIALRPIFETKFAMAAPSGKFDYVQLWYFVPGAGALLFDSRSGDIWEYDTHFKKVEFVGKLVELGKPVVSK